jgi:hypothetical protein
MKNTNNIDNNSSSSSGSSSHVCPHYSPSLCSHSITRTSNNEMGSMYKCKCTMDDIQQRQVCAFDCSTPTTMHHALRDRKKPALAKQRPLEQSLRDCKSKIPTMKDKTHTREISPLLPLVALLLCCCAAAEAFPQSRVNHPQILWSEPTVNGLRQSRQIFNANGDEIRRIMRRGLELAIVNNISESMPPGTVLQQVQALFGNDRPENYTYVLRFLSLRAFTK